MLNLGRKTPIFGNFKGKMEIFSTHDLHSGTLRNVLLSVGILSEKLQLPV